MKLRGHKQATAHSHEHTKNSNRSKKISATKKIEFESANKFQKHPKSFEFIWTRTVSFFFAQETLGVPVSVA